MKRILTSLVLMVLVFPALALGETKDDLVKRDGLYYKNFTDVPFTGNLTGKTQGTIRNGTEEGPWIYYYDNGQLSRKGTYKDGYKDGPWVNYYDNGQLGSKGTYKNGKEDGRWVRYWSNGQLWHKGTYKDGKRDGPRVSYSSDGSEMVVED